MKHKITTPLFFVLATIFLFWFTLSKENFFHMDDWEWVKQYEKGFWGMISTPRDGEHFVPLAGAVFYIFFKFFGFSYVPFQLLNSLVHMFNALLAFKITKLETQNQKISLATALLFGFASTAPDVLVWANSFLINTAGLFYFLGFYFFLMFRKSQKQIYILLSCACLIISPRFQTITTIVPFIFSGICFLLLKRKVTLKPALLYLVTGIINIATTIIASEGNVQAKTLSIAPDLLSQIPLYIFTGIYKGTFLRLINPELYLLANITHITQPIRMALAILLPIVALFAFGQIKLTKKLLWKQNTSTYISYILLLTATYIMVAPFRVHNGVMQATIPRYTYTSVFFMIILFAIMYHSFYEKIGKIVTVGFLMLLSLHIFANYNFNKNWRLNTLKDRSFTDDLRYLFARNTNIFDLNADGIWVLKLSELDGLLAPTSKISFHPPPVDTQASFYLQADQQTKEIYQKLITTYDVYDPPFSVPYSM